MGTDRQLNKEIFAMAWPATLESILVGLIDMVDMSMVSALSLTAAAAVGVTVQPKRILLMVILALNVGATAMVSRRIGEKDYQAANLCMHRFLTYCIILAFGLYTLGFIFARPFMVFAGANEETLEGAVIYFRILVAGQFLQAISLTINACLRAAGKTRVTFTTNVTANLINLLFNYLLIYGKCGFPKMEIAGAAIATSLGSVAAFAISLWSVRKSAGGILAISGKREYWKVDFHAMPSAWPVVASAFQEQFFQRLGLFLYVRLVASLGTVEFALYQHIMNVANLQGYAYDGFAITATAMTGQRLGAGEEKEAEKAAVAALRMSYITGIIMTAVLIFGREYVMLIFSRETYIIEKGSLLLVIMASSCIASAGASTYAGALRGAGDTKSVSRQVMISTTVVRPILAWLFCIPCGLGHVGVWLGYSGGHFLRWYLMRARYRAGNWRRIIL